MLSRKNQDTPEQKVLGILEHNRINIAATLPCDRIKALLVLIEKNIKTIPLTRKRMASGYVRAYILEGTAHHGHTEHRFRQHDKCPPFTQSYLQYPASIIASWAVYIKNP